MRKVVLYELLSLDGVAEEPSWFMDAGPEVLDNLARVIGSQDDVLLGRRTYEYWAGHWPTSDLEPFAGFINGTPKHVATSSPLAPDWSSSTRITGPVADYVADLKARPGGDIGIHGSIALARSLLRARLVDELRLVVAPVVAGRGRRLFDGDEDLRRLELAGVARSESGTLFLDYRA
jgi:dihydrofolate reductase